MTEYIEDKILIGSSSTHQMMMLWEKEYMEKCIDFLNPHGDVLEVGFGMGYSADRIQSYNPDSHTILEPDPVVYKNALEWSKKYKNVKILNQPWPRIKNLKKYDCFFYDPYIESFQEDSGNQPINIFNTNEELISMKQYGCDIVHFIITCSKFLSKNKAKYSYYSCSKGNQSDREYFNFIVDNLKNSLNTDFDCSITAEIYKPNKNLLKDCNYVDLEDELQTPLLEIEFIS